MRLPTAGLALITATLICSPTDAQNPGANLPQHHQGARVEVGAGTTDGSTNGASGPQDKAAPGPKKPSADMCSEFEAEVRKACLLVVVGEAADRRGEAK